MPYKDPEAKRANAAVKRFRERHPDRSREYDREKSYARIKKHYAKFPEKQQMRRVADGVMRFWRMLTKKFGLTQEGYSCMLGTQMACCRLCRVRLHPMTKQCCVDHNHITGQVRGLLCRNCNFGLGHFRDNPGVLRAAADYVENNMFGNYGFSHHQRGQSHAEIVAGAEKEAIAGALDRQQTRIGDEVLQSALEHPGTLSDDRGTLGVQNGDHVVETGPDSFPLPQFDRHPHE